MDISTLHTMNNLLSSVSSTKIYEKHLYFDSLEFPNLNIPLTEKRRVVYYDF